MTRRPVTESTAFRLVREVADRSHDLGNHFLRNVGHVRGLEPATPAIRIDERGIRVDEGAQASSSLGRAVEATDSVGWHPARNRYL